MINGWSATAFNQDPDSTNEIHGDELAKQFGFKGGLVPGVTISAYLTHPAIEAWGLEFLHRGYANVTIVAPLYDGDVFTVELNSVTDTSYRAELLKPDGTVSANADVRLHDAPVTSPRRRGDPVAEKDYIAPAASAHHWSALQASGCLAFRYQWNCHHLMATYLRDTSLLPQLLCGELAFANMSYILGISNWTADGNAHMNPWVHLATESQNYAAIPAGTSIVAEMEVQDIFEKKGHEFFDVIVNLFDESDDQCLSTIKLRAIYRMRGQPEG